MPKDKISFTELTHQVVRESPEPLSFDEIIQRVQAIAPIATKNPKNTIRSAISQSRSVVAAGNGRYGWKPRLITGSAVRLTLSESDLGGKAIELGDDIRELLWPLFFEIQSRSDRSPVHVQLPTGGATQLSLDFLGRGHWGTSGSPEFWDWLKAQHAAPGDHLIFRALDGMAKRYSVEFQPRAARDEEAIAQRNQAVLRAILAFSRSKYDRVMDWDIVSHLMITGHYRQPIPPDPFSEIWTPEVWPSETRQRKNLESRIFGLGQEWNDDEDGDEEWEDDEEWDDWDEDEDWDEEWEDEERNSGMFPGVLGNFSPLRTFTHHLPPEYQPGKKRAPHPSRKAQKGAARTFTLRVTPGAQPDIWRDVEIAEDQTLDDLHLAIQNAFEWKNDHLYSFFMSGRALDLATEIGSPWSDARQHAHQVEVGKLDLEPQRKFLYYFDYAERHEFDVQVVAVNPSAPKKNYPQVVARQGQSPRQYP